MIPDATRAGKPGLFHADKPAHSAPPVTAKARMTAPATLPDRRAAPPPGRARPAPRPVAPDQIHRAPPGAWCRPANTALA